MKKTNNHCKTTTKNRQKEKITVIYFKSKQRYGSPRITLELRSIGYKISRPESFVRTGDAISVAKYIKQRVYCKMPSKA